MSIRAVIFDLFDVLLCAGDLTARHTYETRLGLSENGLEQAMLRSPQFREAIGGRVGESELWRDVARRIGVDPALLICWLRGNICVFVTSNKRRGVQLHGKTA